MTAHYSVTNAVTVQDQNDVNQYGSTFSNTLGVTNTTQDALGRIVLPSAASNPGAPSSFQANFLTGSGIGGRLNIRHSNSQWVPYLPLRQRALAASGTAFSTSATSLTDVTNATVTITTTGGRLLVMFIPDITFGYECQISGGGTNSIATVACLVGAVNLGNKNLGTATPSITQYGLYIPTWEYQPAAGSFTVKLQALVAVNTSTLVISGRLLVLEYAD